MAEDLDALAAQYGGKSSDMDALAAQYGGKTDAAPAAQGAPVAREGIPRSMLDKALNIVTEPAGALVTGALAAPVAGLAGIVGGLAPGPQGQSRDWVNKVQDALTMQPRSPEGRTTLDIGTKPLQWWEHGVNALGEKAADATGSPAVGATVKTVGMMAPAGISRMAGPKVRDMAAENKAELSLKQSQQSVKDASLDEGRAAGYVVPPQSVLTGIAGKKAIKDEAIVRNQEVTNNLARTAMGLGEAEPITIGALQRKRNEWSQPYREVAELSENHPLFQPPFKNPGDTLKQLQEARAEANAYYKVNSGRPGGSPPALKRAERADAKAELLETSLEEAAGALGRPDLIPKMREARKKLAQTYEVERALNVATGDVEAHVLGNLYDKNPKRMTGELATIGKFDQAFRKFTTESSRIEHPGGSSNGPSIASLGLAAARGSPSGFWPAGVAIAGGPTRALLLSDFYQKPNTYAPSTTRNILSAPFSENAPYGIGATQAGMGELERALRK